MRHVLLQGSRLRLDAHVDELGGELGEALLTPTRIYAKDCLSLVEETDVHAFAHVTGGGLASNLSRVLPDTVSTALDRSTWTPPPVFGLVQSRGRVEQAEMERTFNMGVGMVAVLAPEDADRALAVLTARHVPSWVLGEITAGGDGSVTMRGDHPA